MKKKGIKIKRSHRNLYKRRKSTGRKVFETILLLVIVAALVFVGYSVAPPLIKFFSDMSSDLAVKRAGMDTARACIERHL